VLASFCEDVRETSRERGLLYTYETVAKGRSCTSTCMPGLRTLWFSASVVLNRHRVGDFEVQIPQLKGTLNEVVMCTFQS